MDRDGWPIAVRRGAGALAVVVLTLAALEGATRLFGFGPSATPMRGYAPDPVLPFRLQPHASGVHELADGYRFPYRHNSLGFRDGEHQPDKPPGTLRVVGVGDSFTYGVGAATEDGYLAQLERRLNGRPDRHGAIEVINLGVPRFFPAAERLLLEQYGWRFAPDVLVIGVTPNDVVDTFLGLDALAVHESGYLAPRAAQDLGPLATTVVLHSQLARTVLARLFVPRGRGGRLPRPNEIYTPDGFHEPDWRAMERDLQAIARDARGHGARVVIVGIPQSGIDNPRVGYFDQRLAKWSQHEMVVYVSVLAAMRAAAASEPMYWRRDGHCRAAGYAVIARMLADALVRERLVL